MSLFKAQATFVLKPGRELEPQVFRNAVLDAGFTPRDIFITARGNVADKDGQVVFQPGSSPQVFSLVENQELTDLKAEGLEEFGITAKVIGEEPPLSLEIQEYRK